MQPLQADQADFLLNSLFLPDLKNEHGITAKVIEAIPHDKSDHRPDEFSRGALDLAWHIVATEMRFMDAVASGQFDLSPNPRPEDVRNSEELARWYGDHFDPRFEKLSKLSSDRLTKIVDFRGMFQLPAVMYLNFLLHHTIHHRGQLAMCLRPMGAKVPAIYGESHDSAQARKQAQ